VRSQVETTSSADNNIPGFYIQAQLSVGKTGVNAKNTYSIQEPYVIVGPTPTSTIQEDILDTHQL
jgi:hypothetical protein